MLAQSYGLAFNSHGVVQENRTALDLSPNDSLCFEKGLRLDFDLNFLSGQSIYFGYIVRIISGNQNLDLICTQNNFKMVVGQQMTNIVASIDTPLLYNRWTHFSIRIDPEKKELQLLVDGQDKGSHAIPAFENCFRILWGANDHYRFNTRDLPPMRIRDITLFDGPREKYFWSLADTSGTDSYDSKSRQPARVKNPIWIKPLHQHWQERGSFVIGGSAAAAFDPVSDRLFIAGSDSLVVMHPGSSPVLEKYFSGHASLQLGNQAVYDPFTRKLYDVFVDQHRLLSMDMNGFLWNGAQHDSVLTEYWHANKFVSPYDTALYIIGGYGQLKYKNTVQRVSLNGGGWTTIEPAGDPFTPRYLAALGLNAAADTAYIIGGYGSPTGDQMLNPGNYYDMFAFSVKDRRFKKLFSIDSTNPHHVFANSLVMDPEGGSYYGLVFENGSFDTQLRLVKGSLDGSPLEYLGDPIPYSFYDIQSFADLYYSPRTRKLIAVTLFFSPETEMHKKTVVKVFTLDFPPEKLGTASRMPVTRNGETPYLLWILLPLLVLAGWLFWRWYGKKAGAAAAASPGTPSRGAPSTRTSSPAGGEPPAFPAPEPAVHAESFTPPEPLALPDPAGSQVRLFGPFLVSDEEGRDLTKSFTPLLKELFLLILIYTYKTGKGISSETLDETLWYDKSQKDARNNRSVNLAKLKTILEKMGHAVVNRDGGFWQYTTGESGTWIDYREWCQLQASGAIGKNHIRELLRIAGRGPFLPQTEYNWLDDIKSELSNKVIDDCLLYLRSANLAEEAEDVIEIANCIFHFDRLNEDALEFKCKGLVLLKRHALANTIYLKFTKEYREIYGEDFPKSFNEIIR